MRVSFSTISSLGKYYLPENAEPATTLPIPACVAAAHVPAPTPAAPNPKALSPAVIARGAAIPATATVATIFSYQLKTQKAFRGQGQSSFVCCVSITKIRRSMARQYMYRVFQKILDKNLSEKSLKVMKGKKIVKVCLHSSKARSHFNS